MRHGACLCGGVRFRIRGALAPIQVCLCSQCRRAQGGPLATNIPVDAAQFELLAGAELLKAHEATPGKQRVFCGTCGSPVYSRRDSLPGVLRIRAGLLDEPVPAVVGLVQQADSAAPWLPAVGAALRQALAVDADAKARAEADADGRLDLAALQAELRRFADERGWQPFHTPKNLATALVVEAAELAEIFQWLTPEQSQRTHEDATTTQHIGEEVADVLLYLLQLADHARIRIPAAVRDKLARNALKHPAPQRKPPQAAALATPAEPPEPADGHPAAG